MKNVFLTFALMCYVSFAFANEGDNSKKEKSQNTSIENIESYEVKSDVNSILLNLLENSKSVTECFGLSCTTHCTTLCCELEVEESIDAWEKLEAFWCGG